MNHMVIGLAHIGIKTSHMQKSIDFYTNLLGFQHYYNHKLNTGTELNFLRAGSCIIELICNPNFKENEIKKEGTVAHVALEVLNIEALVTSLKDAGIDSWQTESPREVPDLFPGGSRMIFFEGPSGEIIELYEY